MSTFAGRERPEEKALWLRPSLSFLLFLKTTVRGFENFNNFVPGLAEAPSGIGFLQPGPEVFKMTLQPLVAGLCAAVKQLASLPQLLPLANRSR